MAANGKRQFDALGSSWTLAYDINALCRVEERLGIESAQEFQRTLNEKLSFRTLRALFCCGLSPDATEEQAGEIMQEMGIDAMSSMIRETIQAAFPAVSGKDGRKAGNASTPKPTR